jgi:hypothetical protein
MRMSIHQFADGEAIFQWACERQLLYSRFWSSDDCRYCPAINRDQSFARSREHKRDVTLGRTRKVLGVSTYHEGVSSRDRMSAGDAVRMALEGPSAT